LRVVYIPIWIWDIINNLKRTSDFLPQFPILIWCPQSLINMNYFQLLKLFNVYNLYKNRKQWGNLIHCTFHPSNVYRKLTVKDLEPCDMFLFHGHTLLNKAIQSLTDSMYNHVALNLDNNSVLHAIKKGFIQQDFKDAITKDEIVHVYRYHYRGVGGEPLSEVDRTNILFEAYRWRNRGEKYAVAELLELAILTQLRADSDILRRSTLDRAFAQFNEIIENGKEPVICSEGVYRVFAEAGYPVRIIPEGWHRLYSEADSPLLKAYLAQKTNVIPIIADFVTPSDLMFSADFGLVGQLVL
jgi:hypothetical protein